MKGAVIQLGTAILLLLFSFRLLISGRLEMPSSPLHLWGFLFLAWSGISITWAHSRYEAVPLFIHWCCCGLVYLLIVINLGQEKWRLRILGAMVLTASMIAVLGCAQHLFRLDWVPQAIGPAATFANKNIAVDVLIVGLALMIGEALFGRSPGRTAVSLALTVVSTSYLLYTETRAGWLALIVIVVYYTAVIIITKIGYRHYARSPRAFAPSMRKALALGAAIAVIAFMANLSSEGLAFRMSRIAERAASVAEVKTDAARASSHRLPWWKSGLTMAMERPLLGFGLGNIQVFYPSYHNPEYPESLPKSKIMHYLHNDYLQLAVELGIPGLVFFMGVLAAAFIIVRRICRKQAARDYFSLSVTLLAALIGFMVVAFFSHPLEEAIPPLFVSVLLALLTLLHSRNVPSNRLHSLRISKPVTCSLMVALIAGGVMLARFHERNLTGARHYLAAATLAEAQRWPEVIEAGLRAYASNPERVRSLSYVGRAYMELGQDEKGIDHSEKVIQQYPFDTSTLLNLGSAYARVGQKEKAVATLAEVIRIKPYLAETYVNLASIYLKDKNDDEAWKVLRQGVKHADSRTGAPIHYNLGVLEANRKRFDQAVMEFEAALKYNPNLAEAYANAAVIYFHVLKDKEKAIPHMEKFLSLRPSGERAAEFREILSAESEGTAPRKANRPEPGEGSKN
jgi:O-antigen ligase/Flp pilus assembly protein TadD